MVDIPFQEVSDKGCHETDRMLRLGETLSSNPCGIYSSLYLRLLGLQGRTVCLLIILLLVLEASEDPASLGLQEVTILVSLQG